MQSFHKNETRNPEAATEKQPAAQAAQRKGVGRQKRYTAAHIH
jgi:hypothetical protein